MLRPIIQRLTLTAVLLTAVLGTGALIDAGSRARLDVAALAAPASASHDVVAPVESVPVQAERRGPNRRWPFFSFGSTTGKRSW